MRLLQPTLTISITAVPDPPTTIACIKLSPGDPKPIAPSGPVAKKMWPGLGNMKNGRYVLALSLFDLNTMAV